MEFNKLIGKTIKEFRYQNDRVTIECTDGSVYGMSHTQDCCENVYVEDVVGDIDDLIGHPLLEAEEVTSREPQDVRKDYHESFTWTFYKLSTIKGSVTIRWYGGSNGYYSESVDFYEETAGMAKG